MPGRHSPHSTHSQPSDTNSRGLQFSERDLSITLYTVIGLITAGVFVSDLSLEIGIAIWVLYLIPMMLSLLLWQPWTPMVLSLAISILILVGLQFSPEGGDPTRAIINRSIGIATILIVAGIGFSFIKNRLLIRKQQWLDQGRSGLSLAMLGTQTPNQLGENILKFLSEYLGARTGVFYQSEEGGFYRTASYSIPVPSALPDRFQMGEGLAGQAARDRQVVLMDGLAQNELLIGSVTGQWKPDSVLIAPLVVNDLATAVLELAFQHSPPPAAVELMDDVSSTIGIAVQTAQYRQQLQRLLEETQRQAEELQVQGEELRVSNEELEEQSRALLESQARLEQQQVELEQTNTQLEEQAQLLEAQRDDLAQTQGTLERKARDLARASRYKSDFLANMSHELRTPLNSTLILAKLLSENSEGNLTEDQVASAETIFSAGNDLLNLINDILDLSKIEAGRMDLRPETVWISDLTSSLESTLGPLAHQKGLKLHVQIAQGAPESIHTDLQRVEQVLKNLLSNAIKFTDEGSITLRVAAADRHRIALEVIDTGIGIEEDQQVAIFEAFRQVDSAANRKYNGTGLGLSITRQLVHLLGGEIRLVSALGRGSRFTILLPVVMEDTTPAPLSPAIADEPVGSSLSRAIPPESSPFRETASPRPITLTSRNVNRLKDDREHLTGQRPVILVVEDDESFARILYQLSHELDFQCLLANTAEEAVSIATQFLPSAVVLDLGLPDHSGLSVLDQLKHDSRTRHIPVHVVSASDHSEAALSLGAVGYIMKPVTRERLVETLQGLETRLTQRMRRVLLVEDDAVQLESLRKLLGSHDVETIGARSAAECLDQLKDSTFDCMVLDLSLPDASGYSLLETLSKEDSYSFPPVIVYTGADLTADEEHRLRRYSKSIIIKGAKSPERLLDEVSLFLHQIVAELPPEQQRMIKKARSREAALEGRRILIVEDDVRNVFALSSILEPRGAFIQIARNGVEALRHLETAERTVDQKIDLVLMDIMMPEMDGLTATREIRKRPEWSKLPIIALTAKAMKEDQEQCLAAGANDYMAKPLDVEKLLSLVRVWIRR